MKLRLSRDPFRTMKRLQGAMNEDDFFNIDWDETEMDMYEEGDDIKVKLKAPGFDEKNIDISVEDNTLTISGKAEVTEEEEEKQKKYFRREIRNQSFTRSVTLPSRIVPEDAEAEFKNGILHLTLPKAEEAKPKKISVKVSE
jgi:HSP20 family protein